MSTAVKEEMLRVCIDIVSVQQATEPWTTDKERLVRECSVKLKWMCYATPEDKSNWTRVFDETLNKVLEKLREKYWKADKELLRLFRTTCEFELSC